MTQVTIHQVEIDSREAAFQLLSRFFQEEGFATAPHQLQTNLNTMIINPNSAVFLARRDAEAIGVATVTSTVGLEYGRSAELEDLYVLPDERGRGVAGALIEEVCAWCKAQGVSTVLVTVTPEGESRHQLIRYYQEHGFTNTMRLIMERSLNKDS